MAKIFPSTLSPRLAIIRPLVTRRSVANAFVTAPNLGSSTGGSPLVGRVRGLTDGRGRYARLAGAFQRGGSSTVRCQKDQPSPPISACSPRKPTSTSSSRCAGRLTLEPTLSR